MYPKSQMLDPSMLRANGWNTNFVSPDNQEKLDHAIERFGFFKPIIVREVGADYEIIGGEHRWQSALRLKMKSVPVMNLGPIDEQTAKEISLADNARYGADDTIGLAELLAEIGDPDEIQQYLPYTETEIQSIFSSVDIALEDLDIDTELEASTKEPEPAAAKAPKTHTIMRFKVPITDAERLTELLTKTQKRQGFTLADEMTNAGDALVHLLLSTGGSSE